MVSPGGMMRALIVSWAQPNEVNAPLLTYIVSYESADGVSNSSNTGEDVLTFTITELRPFTVYSVSVQACSSLGCGLPSVEVDRRTLEGGNFKANMYSNYCIVVYTLIVCPTHKLLLCISIQIIITPSAKFDFPDTKLKKLQVLIL